MKHVLILAVIVLGIILLIQSGSTAGPSLTPRMVPIIVQGEKDATADIKAHADPRSANCTAAVGQVSGGIPYWDIIKYGGLPLLAVGIVAWRAHRLWRLQTLTDRWYSILEFLHEHPGFMDEEKNQGYEDQYKEGDERWEYESIARMCIGYVDDMYFFKPPKKFRGWLRGSIPLFVGRHRAWFDKNENAYDPGFVRYIHTELNNNKHL